MSVKNRLKQIFDNSRMSLVDISQKCEINYGTLQQYLGDKRKPNTNSLTKLCIHLNIDISWLLTGEGTMYRHKPEKIESLEDITIWLNHWWSYADEEQRIWFIVQIKRCFPEYLDWFNQR
jgi:transcriptional regulator with XRE-family HTH domain